MDQDALRIALAAVIGPLVWVGVRVLLDRRSARTAGRRAEQREQSLQRSYRFGRKLAGLLLRHRR